VDPRDSFPEKKRLARESDNSFPSGTEVKNEWSYNSVFPTPFLDVGSESFILYVRRSYGVNSFVWRFDFYLVSLLENVFWK
jgi:hypothetical protein